MNNTGHVLAHTKWNCKYHIVFAPKYMGIFCRERRQKSVKISDIMKK